MKTVNPCEELDKLLKESGLKVKFGLRAQGHIPTIERMLSEGKSWDDIGRAIGWHGSTAKEWYARELKRPVKRGKGQS